jgi:hypothetical protein
VRLLAGSNASPEFIAALTVPLALFLLLTETAVGGLAAVAYLRVTGGLTRGFLKFIGVTYAALAALALLVALAGPPRSYAGLLGIDRTAAGWLTLLQAAVFITLVGHGIAIWTRAKEPTLGWVLSLATSVLLMVAIALSLAPLAGSFFDVLLIGAAIILSAAVLGAATTGMLLGHWYLVTPALTNRPLLRSIGLLLAGLVLQALVFPLALAGLAHSSGSLSHALDVSPTLTVLWILGGVILPLVAAGLAFPACRMRSFMSTTGLLYMAMIVLLPGQLVGQLLFLVTAAA